MVDLDSMPPDWEFAKNHAKAVKPGIVNGLHMKTSHTVYCQCCMKPVEKQEVSLTANSKQLQFLGFGFPLYFIFVKYSLILLLILICSYSSVSLYWSIQSNSQFCLHRHLSTSNQSNSHCTSFLILFSRIQNILSTQEIIMRIASFVIHLAALIYIRDNIRKTVQYYDEKTTSLSDYSLMMKNLPEKDGIQKSIIKFINEHFKSKWTQLQKTFHSKNFKSDASIVEEITLISNLDDYYSLEEKKNILIQQKRKIIIQEEKAEAGNKVHELSSSKDFQSQVDLINAKIQEVKERINDVKSQCRNKCLDDKLHGEIAIITLNTEMHKNIIVDYCEQNTINCQLVGQYFGYFQGEIQVVEAPQPNQIIWHNLHNTTKDRLCGKIIGWSLTIIFISACTVGFYFILVAKTNIFLHALESYSTIEEVKQSSAYKLSVFLVFLLMFLIVLFNKLIMSWVLHIFTHLQKHQSSSDEQFSFALKYTIGLFFTTALMTLAVQAITYHNFFAHEYGVVEEQSIMFFVNAIFIPLFMAVNPYQIKNRIVRYFKAGKKHYTQAEANQIMSDNPYTIGKEYAQIIQTLWFTYLYATMIPIGAFITFFGIAFYYWTDKYNLLRRSSLSHNVSGQMVIYALKLLDCTLIMKPIGQIIFDEGIRDGTGIEAIILVCIAFVYILLPMNSILQFLHEERFQQEEKSYSEVKTSFIETYRTLHPVMNHELDKIFQALKNSIGFQISMTYLNIEENNAKSPNQNSKIRFNGRQSIQFMNNIIPEIKPITLKQIQKAPQSKKASPKGIQ